MKMIESAIQNLAKKYAHFAMQKSLYNSLNIDVTDKNIKKIPSPDKDYMLYMHVPFCHTFCPYCSFHKYQYQQDTCKKYFKSLREELKQVKAAGYDFSTLYVGGGTTLIDEDELLETLELVKKLFNIKEISCESDPNHIARENLIRFKGLIDRLSVGVQSFNDDILRKVARYDKFGSQEILKEKLSNAVGVLPILSLDLIFNFPFQSASELRHDIKIAKSINPEQITFYPLMKSNLTRTKIASALGISDVDREEEFYHIIREEFKDYYANNAWAFSTKSSGLSDEYVGSNHEYLGVGSGAFSFLNGRLLINAFNLNDYSNLISQKRSPVIATCDFSEIERVKYLFLTELFSGKIDIAKFNAANKIRLERAMFKELKMLQIAGAIEINQGIIKTKEFGSYLSVAMMKDFYAGMDLVRAIFKDDAKIKTARNLKIMNESISQNKFFHKDDSRCAIR